MSNNRIIKASIIILVLLTIVVAYFYGQDQVTIVDMEGNTVETSNEITALESKPFESAPLESSSPRLANNPKTNDSGLNTENLQQTVVPDNTNLPPQKSRIPFDGDWCFRTIDLNEEDLNYSLAESDDWNIKRGKLNFANWTSKNNAPIPRSESLVAPYRDMDIELLFDFSKFGDDVAMQALLARNDFDSAKKDDLAKRLLVLGKTGNALSHLVIKETVPLMITLRNGHEFKEQEKTQLAKAIAYVNYGLKRYDTTGLDALMEVFDQEDGTQSAFAIISEDDMRNAAEWLAYFENDINQRRSNRKLGPIAELGIPKIAKHDFKFDLALGLVAHSKSMGYFSDLNASNVNIELADDCVKQLAAVLQ